MDITILLCLRVINYLSVFVASNDVDCLIKLQNLKNQKPSNHFLLYIVRVSNCAKWNLHHQNLLPWLWSGDIELVFYHNENVQAIDRFLHRSFIYEVACLFHRIKNIAFNRVYTTELFCHLNHPPSLCFVRNLILFSVCIYIRTNIFLIWTWI